LSSIGQYLKICTAQLVEFQSSEPCHIDFFINLELNNYLKVKNVDRNDFRGFYRSSKLANFWAFRHLISFLGGFL